MHDLLLKHWRTPGWLSYCLLPLAWLYGLTIHVRRFGYKVGLLKSYRSPVPVVVIGNISVGGSGKTPLLIALVNDLQQRGFRPGIISRGYRGDGPFPLLVDRNTPVSACGDEAAMIVRHTDVPVVVGANRRLVIERLLETAPIDIILSDDGLQHYAMQRDIEIAVEDRTSERRNSFLLPAGPLREPVRRLQSVNYCVEHVTTAENQGDRMAMWLRPGVPQPLMQMDLQLPAGRWHAVAGIGNPERFFNSCEQLGLEITRHPFPDHHDYKPDDIEFDDRLPVIMTEKDAIKCMAFASDRHWFLPVTACISSELLETLTQDLNRLREQYGQEIA